MIADIETVGMQTNPTGDFYYAWVMSTPEGNNWDQIGWSSGAVFCGTNAPVVTTQYNNNGTLGTYCYGKNYPLAQGAAYFFAVEGDGGNNWCTLIYYNNQWNYVNCYNLPWTAVQGQAESNIEFYSPSGLSNSFPNPAGSDYFTNDEIWPNGQAAFVAWNQTFPTVTGEPSADPLGWFEGFNLYYWNWYITSTKPAVATMASPTSESIKLLGTASSTITVTANSAWDQFQYGPVLLSVSGQPTGVTASVSQSTLYPMANQHLSATLTVTDGVELSPYTITVHGCPLNGAPCSAASVKITPVL